MKILIADDELTAVKSLVRSVKKVLGEDTEIDTARSGKEVLALLAQKEIDVLFLDVEMPGMNGMDVAKKVRASYPKTNVIIVTAYPQYSLKAWELYISGYLLKPVGTAKLAGALENLRRQPAREEPERLKVQCFGSFEVFFRGGKVVFGRSVAKEIFACLVAKRGAGMTSDELCEMLWPDSAEAYKQKRHIRVYYAEIRKTLAQISMEDVLVHTRNDYAINPERIDCDYYRYLDGDEQTRRQYQGEFMNRYEWAAEIRP